MSIKRVLISGARDYEDYYEFEQFLSALLIEKEVVDPIIIHGGADGADELADRYAEWYAFRCLRFPAKWKIHGKAAGPLRNKQMLIEGKPHLVVAFPTENSIGTRHMIKIAKEAGVEVIVKEVTV